MRHNTLIVPALALMSLLQGCVMYTMHRASLDKNFTSTHVEGSSLTVTSRNGSIEVIADPSLDEVVIDTHITCGGATLDEARQRVADATLVIERDTSRMLSIRPEFPGGPRNGDGANIVIHLPDAYGVKLDTGNGRVMTKGLSGTLVIDTSNGRVTVEEHDGEAQIRTSNGRIEVTEQGGPLDARTSNGRITVTLADDQEGPIHLKSSNGTIIARVGSAFQGRVTFDTSNGHIEVEGDDNRIRRERIHRTDGYIVVGEGEGAESRIDTSNGSIEFEIRN